MKKRYYIAYGSNLNVEQMALRCPHATILGTAELMLAHLLEHGHAKRGGGRVRANPHIAPAEEVGVEQLEQDILRGLKE